MRRRFFYLCFFHSLFSFFPVGDLELRVSRLFVVSAAAPLPIQVSDCSVPPAVFVAQKQAQKKIQVRNCFFFDNFFAHPLLVGPNRRSCEAPGGGRGRGGRNRPTDRGEGFAEQDGQG